MKIKQLIAIIVTGIVIIAVGITGVMSNVLSQSFMQGFSEEEDILTEFMGGTSDYYSVELPEEEFIGLLYIVGEIGPSTEDIWGTTTSGTYNHSLYMEYVDQLIYDDNNQGLMLYVDSPGGTVYESDELYLKLMEYKEVTGRPIWAYFASEACSGGYYIAMAADKIYANRNCWTGSIGVIVSMMNTKGLYDKLGIEEIDITSGENKAMGSSGLELTEEQRDILQSLVDEAYDQFVEIVCEGRKMDEATVRKLADGRIYSAKQALEVNLIDAIGSFEDEQLDFAAAEGFHEYILYHSPEAETTDLWSSLYWMLSDLKPESDSDIAKDIVENNGNGVLKYYAK